MSNPSKQADYGKVVRIQIPSNPRFVSHTRNYFFNLCLEHGFSLFDSMDLKLVIGEAITNIIRHAYLGNTNKPIFIEIQFDRDRVEIKLRDYGIKVEPKDLRSFDVSDYREHGIGLFMIRELTDYYFLDQSFEIGNQMVLIKRK
ncbi:ATP-binding protein [Leptospira jelokensis]|uniref:ATP-binding protein n=1 Tax=Leptospira jelokensis TaxID=2484931 RepID=UPI001090C6B6|nr:ATP-binding protein [Leptospira jelokensis]TGM04967.1 ATP-binding protein [Leptospira jelokensis]